MMKIMKGNCRCSPAWIVSGIMICILISFFSCNWTGKTDMDAFEVIHNRRSVRAYQSVPVPGEHILQILDAARMAPTAGNQQPWKFMVVEDSKRINAIKMTCIEDRMKDFRNTQNPDSSALAQRYKQITEYYSRVFSAPVYIVVLTDSRAPHAGFNSHDGPLAAGYLMLAARALGYGTVYYTSSIPDYITRNVLNIPDRYQRVCITPVGVPQKWPETPDKKPLEALVVYDQFDEEK